MMNTMGSLRSSRASISPLSEADEVRVQCAYRADGFGRQQSPAGFAFWSLGEPGHCAMRSPGWPILLGDLSRSECHRLPEDTISANCGAIGVDERPHWFAERASALGARFDPPIPQRINILYSMPRHPNVPGSMREVTVADAPLLFVWITAFQQEAVPHDPPPRDASMSRRLPAAAATSSGPSMTNPYPWLVLRAGCGTPDAWHPSICRPSSATAVMLEP